MIPQLPAVPVPAWLRELSRKSLVGGGFPVHQVLENSLFYPACGLDGSPIRYLAGNVHSFVYVDCGVSQEEYNEDVRSRRFKGYKCIGMRPVRKDELTPKDWHLASPDPCDHDSPGDCDASVGRPNRRRGLMSRRTAPYEGRGETPFCSWSVWQRREEFPCSHGPDRFSLLYLGAEGAEAFQELYLANAAVPFVVAIIQPGKSRTNFEDPNMCFAKSVVENPAGRPRVLLYGGIADLESYSESCWPKHYEEKMCSLKKSGGWEDSSGWIVAYKRKDGFSACS